MILGAGLVETKRNCCFVRYGVWKALWKHVLKETANAKLMPFVLLACRLCCFLTVRYPLLQLRPYHLQ
jgi:hypothetical protein